MVGSPQGPFLGIGGNDEVIFEQLKPGDEITIAQGCGYPEAEADTTAIIADVGGLSALTASGIKLMCTDAKGITRTGNHFDSFPLSEEAQRILSQLRR